MGDAGGTDRPRAEDGTAEAQRSRIARNAALRRHALGDPVQTTAPARQAFLHHFREQVDAAAASRGEQLADRELEKRTDRLVRAHMIDLARRSVKASPGPVPGMPYSGSA